MFTDEQSSTPTVLAWLLGRGYVVAISVGLAVAALSLASAGPAFAFNPCSEPNPPPRCSPYDPAPPQPAAPTNLTISGALTSTATLTWTDTATTEASYSVYRWSGTLSSVPSTLGTAIATLPAHSGTGQSYVDSGLDPNGAYTYAVVAYSVLYRSSPGTFGTLSASSSAVNFPGVPVAPTGLSLSPDPSRSTANWNQSVIATWTNQATNAAGIRIYGVQSNTGHACDGSGQGATLFATLPGPTATYTFAPRPGEQWCFYADAFNASGQSNPVDFPGWVEWGSQPPPPPPPSPAAGVDLTTWPVGGTIRWYWQGHPGDTSYNFTVTDETTTKAVTSGSAAPTVVTDPSGKQLTGGSFQDSSVLCSDRYELKVVTVRPGYLNSPGVTAEEAPTCAATAAPVTGLKPSACGNLCVEWNWTGHPGDTQYHVATKDLTTGQLAREQSGLPAHHERGNRDRWIVGDSTDLQRSLGQRDRTRRVPDVQTVGAVGQLGRRRSTGNDGASASNWLRARSHPAVLPV